MAFERESRRETWERSIEERGAFEEVFDEGVDVGEGEGAVRVPNADFAVVE